MRHTVVIGGGGSGIPLAVRLAEDPGRTVTLIEAGPLWGDPALADGGRMVAASPTHPNNWAYPAQLSNDRATVIARGRVLGGSTATNGGVFTRAVPADFARWALAGGLAWTYRRALPLLNALEHDLDYPGSPLHGHAGPIPVQRAHPLPPAAQAFVTAAMQAGFAAEPDTNAGAPPGVGAVPSNIVAGVRMDTVRTYRPQDVPALRVLAHTRAHRVIFAHRPAGSPRAIGVETSGGRIPADEVVLAAGAIGSAHLLLLSGVGPAEELEAWGITPVSALPVGTAFSDHPNLALEWRSREPSRAERTDVSFTTMLTFGAGREGWSATHRPPRGTRGSRDLEVLLPARHLSRLLGVDSPDATSQHALVSLQAPASRGRLRLGSADPEAPPALHYRSLATSHDRVRLRSGIRTTASLLQSPALRAEFAGFTDLTTEVLASDEALDSWIRDRVGTALHTAGTAPMGAVVDGVGRVHGTVGLRVADVSILPVVPHRPPANTAVFIGELIARAMRTNAG